MRRRSGPILDPQSGIPTSLGSRITMVSLIQTLAVAEYLNFRHAANALGVGQSSVSARVKALEEDLGILLFERHARGVRLTEAGRRFVERIAAGVDQLDHAVKTAGMAAAGTCGRLDAIVNSRNLGEVFSNVARQIIADLAAIAVRQSITEPLARMLFGGGNGVTVGAKAVGASQGAAQGASWLTKIAGFLGFAGGGRVSGPGSEKSDSILARLSNGEFVINAEQTRKHLPLLEMINGGRLPGFANGGLAMGLTPDGDGAYITLSGPSEVIL